MSRREETLQRKRSGGGWERLREKERMDRFGEERGRNKKFGGQERRRRWSRVFFLFFPNVTGEIRRNKYKAHPQYT